MTPRSTDTIAALATPPGRGAISIVRISGTDALAVAEALTRKRPIARQATFCRFATIDGVAVDQGLMLYFPAPRSFTGEDVVELHGHGGTVVSDSLLAATLAAGARLAEPGEFSLRAFLNDKLDLAQAEAVADLIDSGSRAAARAALRSLDGRFSERVSALQDSLTELRVQVEAWIDFPDEELERDDCAALEQRFVATRATLAELFADARQGAVLQSGLSIVIAGPPNAGKSSLLNCLAGHNAAIVTAVPGTTRDPLRERIALDGLPINIVDTAGLRSSDDPVESEGIRRSHAAIARADRMLWVVDVREPLEEMLALARSAQAEPLPFTIVQNKVDLVDQDAAVLDRENVAVIRLSALTGEGLPLLIAHLRAIAGFAGESGGTMSARTRHVAALERAQASVAAAHDELYQSRALELVAEELRQAQLVLGEITGEQTSDDLLGEIFASFCIGK